MMSPRRIRFAREYCVDFNATQAAIRAGYSEDTAYSQGSRLLKDVEVAARVEEVKEEIAAVATLDAAWVLRQWKQIAEADPNELTQLRRGPCPECWSPERKETYGVLGFDLKEPCPECILCDGEGREVPHFADTRKLKGSARKLFAGVKVTRNGIEVKTHDQDAARRNIADYLGMLKTRTELSGPGGGPVSMVGLTAEDLSEAELMAIAAAAKE